MKFHTYEICVIFVKLNVLQINQYLNSYYLILLNSRISRQTMYISCQTRIHSKRENFPIEGVSYFYLFPRKRNRSLQREKCQKDKSPCPSFNLFSRHFFPPPILDRFIASSDLNYAPRILHHRLWVPPHSFSRQGVLVLFNFHYSKSHYQPISLA